MEKYRIERVVFSGMNPAPYHPRVELHPGDPEYDALKKSIEEFGCVSLIVWNKRTGNIVGGHQRFRVEQDLGHTDADVVVVDLDDTQEKVLNLALNKVQGRWDNDKLVELLEELQGVAADVIGFSEAEMERLISNAHLDMDAFFRDVEGTAVDNADDAHEDGDIQCPHCKKWFKAV